MPRNLNALILTLASLALLTGCAQIPAPAPIAAGSLCKSWKHQQISRNDKLSEGTASQIEGNNKARPEWGCQYGKDEAKAG